MILQPGADLAQLGFVWSCSCGAEALEFLSYTAGQIAVQTHADAEHGGRVSVTTSRVGRLTMDDRDGYIYDTAKGRDVPYVPGYFGPMW